jgi:hypothetical protein
MTGTRIRQKPPESQLKCSKKETTRQGSGNQRIGIRVILYSEGRSCRSQLRLTDREASLNLHTCVAMMARTIK